MPQRDGQPTVHPRVCGEHESGKHPGLSHCGSSPRVRGTQRKAWIVCAAIRFIPACAGNTTLMRSPNSLAAVHPRVCGEHTWSIGELSAADGSSPRVRGTPPGINCQCCNDRFIPACAGNTGRSHRRPAYAPVHPRVCGEHPAPRTSLDGARGSSPRVRGTRWRQSWRRCARRFIPACAGNTPNRCHR